MSLLKTKWRYENHFLVLSLKTAYDKKMILDQLEKDKLDFKKCRGIEFDNAAIMAGLHDGVQHFLRNINGKVKFVILSNEREYTNHFAFN